MVMLMALNWWKICEGTFTCLWSFHWEQTHCSLKSNVLAVHWIYKPGDSQEQSSVCEIIDPNQDGSNVIAVFKAKPIFFTFLLPLITYIEHYWKMWKYREQSYAMQFSCDHSCHQSNSQLDEAGHCSKHQSIPKKEQGEANQLLNPIV